ncbi:MIF4-like type 1/2/3 [Penicillium coprophilum]|uniref:MIF4-like type 1/2/3 n=1 Tax=Penicillium coprophilum TaxID=36646 RepID=UPI00238BE443|nr:MIF4-like type 1/2/3 [Penicillium coprophilum]KAJ5154386.1 MIF4-like type 1/2/3 [Penicillium coprophilum]
MPPRPRHNTTALPRDLRSELGIRDVYGDKKRRLNGPASRKERRQNERTQKKSRHAAPPSKKTLGRPQQRPQQKPQQQAQHDSDEEIGDDDIDLNSDDMDLDERPSAPQTKAKSTKEAAKKPKSILKKAAVPQISESESEPESGFGSEFDLDEDEDEDEDDESSDESEDDTYEEEHKETEVHIPGSVKAKLAQDDAEIAALEKKLGLKKGGKPSKGFEEDGLEDLLGDLGGAGGDASEDESKKRKREADDWLRNKRLKAKSLQAQQLEKDDSEVDSAEDFDLDEEIFGGDDSDAEGSDFDGFDEEERKEPKKKENPYIAPVTKPEPTAQKYIPPSLRGRSDPETESLTRLKRQAQGHLNKLSEANMLSIVAEFEKLYRDYPRQHVTSTLIELLMGMICERAALQDTFLILHAGFIAALYKLMGMDVGAEIIQTVVETLDADGDERGKFQGKEATNLVSLLSQLYNFHVIGSSLMFDYVRLYVQDITESNTELLLKVIRNSGPQLRLDDPSALKDIVLLIQPAVAKAGEDSLSVRTKFMIDLITDLKNNRSKASAAVGAGITTEHITKMRKILGSLNSSRTIRASEPINISRDDIHNSSKKGKWWLVGASWKEDPLVTAQREMANLPMTQPEVVDDESDAEPDFGVLARAHRMNTDVRRSIFVAIMSANDFQDAHVRLMKLRLKRAQEYEIPRVLLHCAMEEQAHNPYYSLIARRICGEQGRRMKMSFMFALWNMFKKMGERGDTEEDEDNDFDPDDEENGISMKSVVNLAKMFCALIMDGSLTLSILKNLNFAYLQPKTKTFVEVLIISIIQQSQKSKKKKKSKSSTPDEPEQNEGPLMQIFLRTKETPHIAKGLIYFVRKVVAKTDIVSDEELKLVRWGCNVAAAALKAVAD